MGCGICNSNNTLYDLQPENSTSNLIPRIRPYSGWASYKNNKSGNFNRSLCWNCAGATSFPQTPGVYDLNIDNRPVRTDNLSNTQQQQLQDFYDQYQRHRLSNHGGQWNGYYINYLNTQCVHIPPKKYVKGYWPDEQKQVTYTPVHDI